MNFCLGGGCGGGGGRRKARVLDHAQQQQQASPPCPALRPRPPAAAATARLLEGRAAAHRPDGLFELVMLGHHLFGHTQWGWVRQGRVRRGGDWAGVGYYAADSRLPARPPGRPLPAHRPPGGPSSPRARTLMPLSARVRMRTCTGVSPRSPTSPIFSCLREVGRRGKAWVGRSSRVLEAAAQQDQPPLWITPPPPIQPAEPASQPPHM